LNEVIVFPRGQLSAKDRRLLAKVGVPVVEADDPSKVVMLLPTAAVPADEILAVALEALAGEATGAGHRAFVVNFAKAVRKRVAGQK
jgi:hypothetical protein